MYVTPSALPADEQATAISTLRDILVNLGFRTGVFHVEARMVNSTYEYRAVDGIIDLVPKPPSALSAPSYPLEAPTCKLIEINARPPGYRVSVPSQHTYGVDFFAARMLAAVGDLDRLRLVARPFDRSPSPLPSPPPHLDFHSHSHSHPTPDTDQSHTPTPNSAQYHARLVYVPAPRAGVIKWPTGLPPCEELKRRRPDLAQRIVLAVDYCVPGERVEVQTDGARTYVAHLLVVNRESRAEAVRVGDEVLKELSGSVVVVEDGGVGEI